MTDGSVGATKGDFDHDDVEGQTNGFISETPASELFVGGAGFDGDEWLRGIGDEGDTFEFRIGIDFSCEIGEEGALLDGDEHEEDLIVVRVEITRNSILIEEDIYKMDTYDQVWRYPASLTVFPCAFAHLTRFCTPTTVLATNESEGLFLTVRPQFLKAKPGI